MNTPLRWRLAAVLGFALAGLTTACIGSVVKVSTDGNMGRWTFASGILGNESEYAVSVNTDGRYVAYVTDGRNLEDDHLYGQSPVAVLRDMQTGSITPVSQPYDNQPVSGGVDCVSVSGDGHYVVFCTAASNMVSGDGNNTTDVFLRDMWAGTTVRVSVPDAGGEANAGSWATGRCISADGRYIVFASDASNLVSGDTNGLPDVFVRDLQARRTYLVSKSTAGVQSNGGSEEPTISSTGRYITFFSSADNLVSGLTGQMPRVYLRDMDPAQNKTSLVATGVLGSVSSDGRYVTYNTLPGTGSPWSQVYIHDMTAGTDKPVSVAPDGVTLGNRDSMFGWLSDSGRYVYFTSKARNIAANDTNNEADAYVRDLQTNVTTRLSVADDGLQGARASGYVIPSRDGRYGAFVSASEDLVPLDFNEAPDVFLAGPLGGTGIQTKDISAAAAIMGGSKVATSAEMSAYNLVKAGASVNRVDMQDAVRISRIAAGLDTNP